MIRGVLIVLAVTAALSLVVHLMRNWRRYAERGKTGAQQAASAAKEAAQTHGPALRDRAEHLRDQAVDAAGGAREKAKDLGQRAGEAGRSAMDRAGDLGDKASDVAGRGVDRMSGLGAGMTGTRVERHYAVLGRTLVIDVDPAVIEPAIADEIRRIALFDEATPEHPESRAWVYEAMGTVRIATEGATQATPEGGEHRATILGVRRFEVVMEMPQGAGATQETLDAVVSMLATQGHSYRELQRDFAPGPEDLSEGPRLVQGW